MKNLNSFWTILVALGIIIFLGTAAWNILRGLSGADNEFNEQVRQLPGNELMPEYLENHLTGSYDIENSDPLNNSSNFNN